MWSSNRVVSAVTVGLVCVAVQSADAAVDLSMLEVVPQRGQSADQTRRDRYECHNWAIDQTGVSPQARPPADEDDEFDRARRVDRVITGAGIGAMIGSLIRGVQHKDPSNGVLAGAAVGAAVGAATGRANEADERPDPADDYLRALGACLEGRGYTVSVPLG